MKRNIKSELKIEVEGMDKEYQKLNFIEELTKHPDQLETLSLDRIVRIREYYEEKIEKIKRKKDING